MIAQRVAVRGIDWLGLFGILFSVCVVLEDASCAAQQEARDNDGQQTTRGRAHYEPSVNLEPDDKGEHHNHGDSALSEDAEGKGAEKQADDKSNDDDCEPGC